MDDPVNYAQMLADKDEEIAKLKALLNSPIYDDFLEGVKREAAHQILRWSDVFDRNKGHADWFWLVGYLAGKALKSALTFDVENALHHTISAAAALFNWHTFIRYYREDEPEAKSDLEKFLEEKFGPLLDKGEMTDGIPAQDRD